MPPVALPPERLRLVGAGDAQPTLVLDAGRLGRLREAAKHKTPAWLRLSALCEEQSKSAIRSGYQGFDWADAIANLTLCWHATSDPKYARTAIGYVEAMLDDRYVVGDGKGGADVVTHDSGYGIRTFGAYTALAYDWLRGAPEMNDALRRRITTRLSEWLSWYEKSGYLNDHPLANYFWGYFTALSLAGLAVGEDAPQAKEWRQKSRRLLENKVLPAFRTHLVGGDWPEGWQYGEYVAVEAALIAKAYETKAGVALAKQMPWFGELVIHHVHSLSPDQRTVYGGGTWGERPARPSALAVAAAAIVLDGLDDKRAAKARWLLDHLPKLTRERAWVALLAERPDAPRKDPRPEEPKSRSFRGTGLTLLRSDWSPEAVWVSFQAGPRLTPDHQHKDQGHFEISRGSDWLLVDGGNSEGGATINHNCLLIDDGARLITYSPNQGVWGTDVRTTRHGDDGKVAVVVGDVGDAWAPACVRDGCRSRAVRSATRTLTFVRPALVVIDDRVSLEDGETRTTWAAHVSVAPELAGKRASAVVGRSRVDVQVVLPDGATIDAVREPNGGGDGPHRASSPWGPMWRLEVKSRSGDQDRRFLTWITSDDKAAAKPALPTSLSGTGLSGARGVVSGKPIALVFADRADGGKIALGAATATVVVVGLDPAVRYRTALSPESGCSLEVAKSDGGEAPNAGGFLRLDVAGCKRR